MTKIVDFEGNDWLIDLRVMDSGDGQKNSALFPWTEPTCPLLFVDLNGHDIWISHTVNSKLAYLKAAKANIENLNHTILVFAAWPGKKRQDIFLVDIDTAIEKLTESA